MKKQLLLLTWIFLLLNTLGKCQGIDPGDVGKIRAEFRLGAGGGTENHPVFESTNGTTINISAGGGLAVGLNLGYRLYDPFELSSEFMYQISVLDQPVSNASGKFHRFVVAPTAKYLIFLKKSIRRISINVGAGYGFYSAGRMEIDGSRISGSAHNIYDYKNSSGPHGCIEFELCNRKKMSFIGGIKYYNVKYSIEKVQSDGYNIPLNIIPADIMDEIAKIDGSGLDMYAGISYLF